MKEYCFGRGKLQLDDANSSIAGLWCGEQSLLHASLPLFALHLRTKEGASLRLTACESVFKGEKDGALVYDADVFSLRIFLRVFVNDDALEWRMEVKNAGDVLVESIDLPEVCLPPLLQNSGIGKVLYPYNERALIDDLERRERSWFPSAEPSYPSKGSYPVFPNMLCSQFMCYLFEGQGFYMASQDPARGVKTLDLIPFQGGVRMLNRIYCGTDFGSDYRMEFPVCWRFFEGDWQNGAELYRSFVEAHLPPYTRKIREDETLPSWYHELPVSVAYPVRGVHDMDAPMQPNRLFPYLNALPHLEAIEEKTGAKLLALLMHWEGTAPWAPPYVMPPYGGTDAFDAFRDALHQKGHLLGVYCSGFGYTLQSNLIDSYRKELSETDAEKAMCTGYDGCVAISNICTAQRRGYDICPASERGREILWEAYRPLFESGIDYAQILDQNHGGGQYFCHSQKHGHPQAPGNWMTKSMQSLLREWTLAAPGMLFGCESAAAEPFIGALRFSDNRYELNYRIGTPVPLYSYLYHEYLHNFMGNQVCSPFDFSVDSLPLRLAYSFAAGDCMTLVMGQDGEILSEWGQRDFSVLPDRENALSLVRNLTAFYRREAKPYLAWGRMCVGEPISFEDAVYPLKDGTSLRLPCVFTSAWEVDGKRAQILVNHTAREIHGFCGDRAVTLPPMDAILIDL